MSNNQIRFVDTIFNRISKWEQFSFKIHHLEKIKIVDILVISILNRQSFAAKFVKSLVTFIYIVISEYFNSCIWLLPLLRVDQEKLLSIHQIECCQQLQKYSGTFVFETFWQADVADDNVQSKQQNGCNLVEENQH